ncbi:MAG: OmpA family protein [Verrucomicrobiales bacterium]
MSQDYSWDEREGFEEPPKSGFGWSVLLAIVLALLAHLALIIWGVNKVLVFTFTEPEEWVSDRLRLQEVQISPEELPDAVPDEDEKRPEGESELLEEIDDLLPELHNVEVDIATEVLEPELPDMKLETPALSGAEEGLVVDPVEGPEVNPESVELGQVSNLFPEVKSGQLVVDQGKPIADVLDPNALAEEMALKKGAGGLSDKGVLSGYTGLEAYSKMSPGDLQVNKASIGSDLLFEFNKATLRSDAKNTLFTVGMLIEKNPDMFCWVEGHTDLIGDDDYNMRLSRERAEAVRDWLVRALRINADRIIVRPFGKTQPLVTEGDADAQAPNRRVDIKMRQERPDEEPVRMLVKPGRAVIVDEEGEPMSSEIPKAVPVPEDAEDSEIAPPRAQLVPEDEETPGRAVVVPE